MTFDYQEARQRLDGADMFGEVVGFPEQFRNGWISAADLEPRHRIQEFDNVLILGMGGSAISGDLLRTYSLQEARVPVAVLRDYRLPAWVGRRTLIIVSSYSGNTEETLSALDEAFEADAVVYAITSGGTLQDVAVKRDLPHIVLPGGMQPRAALGASLAAVLRMADKLGLIDITDEMFEQTCAAMQQEAERLSQPYSSRAAEIASTLYGRLTVVYAGTGLLEAVALRWANQIQENAKQMACSNLLPELNHNEIMGWEHAPESLRQQIAVVMLRDSGDHPQVSRRMDITRDLLVPRAGAWIEYQAEGQHALTRMLTTLQLGDFVSYYLAMRAGIDPTPVDTIERLKTMLVEG